MGLIELLIIFLVVAFVFYILTKYVVPALPRPWGVVILVITAIVVVLFLLDKIGMLAL